MPDTKPIMEDKTVPVATVSAKTEVIIPAKDKNKDTQRIVSTPATVPDKEPVTSDVSTPAEGDIFTKVRDFRRGTQDVVGKVTRARRAGHRVRRLPDNIKNRVGYDLSGLKSGLTRDAGKDMLLGAGLQAAEKLSQQKQEQKNRDSKNTPSTSVSNTSNNTQVSQHLDMNKPYDTDSIFRSLQSTLKVY
jgi:hypothetical protein